MKTGFATAFTLLLVLVIAGSTARANDRQEIDALYTRFKHAFLHKDYDALTALESPDFTDKGPKGRTLNAQQANAEIKQQFANTKSVKKMDVQIKKLTIQGKNATALTNFTFAGVIVDTDGEMGAKGKTHAMMVIGSTRDTLIKTAKGWRFKTFSTTSKNVLVDGKSPSSGRTP